MLSLLIVDDDVEYCIMLRDYMARHAVTLSMCHTGYEGLERLRGEEFDLALLDIMLPGLDGRAVLRSLTRHSEIPLVMLTALSEEEERIVTLDGGADDYITKPINPRELLARVHAVLRRSTRRSVQRQNHAVLINPSLDSAHRCLRTIDQSVPLTDVEYSILQALMRLPGTVCTRDQLVQEVYQREFHPMDRSLDMQISRLRKKLDLEGVGITIRTVRNTGYVLQQQSSGQCSNGAGIH
jgi:DNA-binding response OmpR family regulator